MKIVLIGAGSAGFCKTLVQDIVSYDTMHDALITLMDIDELRLNTTFKVMNNIKSQYGLNCNFEATTDRRKALIDADFAISMIQVGGLEPYKIDIEIPLKYGIDQCVGDTINPGGIFRGLRHIPALLEILKDMEEVCPEVIFMNYANPMAICSWAMQKAFPDIISVGLCHGVQHTTDMLCKWLEKPVEECDILTAGINHMAWFIKFRYKNNDIYPEIWKKLELEGCIKGEEYRFEMMKATGYFMTESSGHLSEYLPYFRKRRDIQNLFGGRGFSGETGAYLKMCLSGLDEYNKQMTEWSIGQSKIPFTLGKRSVEYAAGIMNSRISGEISKFAGNILNKGFIENLPYNVCVEIPIYVDRLGLHGSYVGRLPEHCAALCQSNISVQELAVQAATHGDHEALYHACLLDPLTGAVLAPHEIRNMVDEMIIAQKQWLPQFKDKMNIYPGHTIGRIEKGTADLQNTTIVKNKIGHYD